MLHPNPLLQNLLDLLRRLQKNNILQSIQLVLEVFHLPRNLQLIGPVGKLDGSKLLTELALWQNFVQRPACCRKMLEQSGDGLLCYSRRHGLRLFRCRDRVISRRRGRGKPWRSSGWTAGQCQGQGSRCIRCEHRLNPLQHK